MHNTTHPNQPTVGFLKLLRQWKGRIVGLVSSTIELWTPTLDLSSLASHNSYTLNTRKYYLHYYTVSLGHTFPSSALQGVHKGLVSPSWFVCEFPLFYRFISQFWASSTPKPRTEFRPKPACKSHNSQGKTTHRRHTVTRRKTRSPTNLWFRITLQHINQFLSKGKILAEQPILLLREWTNV